MSNGERHTHENMSEKGMPTAAASDANLSARTEARIKELEGTTNGLSRDVGVLQEKMTHLATREDVAKLEVEIAQVRAENREGIAELRAETREGFAQVDARIAQLESRMWRALGYQTALLLTAIISALAVNS